ncbi:hypothetical protein MNV49_007556 [Pseudohyphozyma bogoriensis]|nr:hypothetical protein MNV49_007556 [Pseudohyphozyma bogoriensis]
MGNNTSSSGAGGKRGSQALDAARSASIDAELKKAKIALKNEVKLLLLGSGESGKSTILKQVRLAYKEGFTQAERQRYTELILDNIFYNTRDLLDGYSVLGIPIPTSCVLSADLINDSGIEPFEDDGKMKLEVVEAVRRIWDESETKEVVKRANEFQLSDSAAYFFDDLDRIAAQDYLPSDDDILRTRIRTTGVVEESV